MGVIKDNAGNPIHSGNPLYTRAMAVSRTANTTIANGTVTDIAATAVGAITVKPFSIPELDWMSSGTAVVDTTDRVLKAALASNRNYLTSIQIQNTHATVGTEVVIKDGSTVIWRGYAQANMQDMLEINFSTPLKTSVNVALNFAAITTGANIYVNAQGYQAP
jgi:hypothetical protein